MKKGFPMKTRLDQRADKISADGHCYITIDGVDYLAEELAFFYTTGQWSKYGVEHVNWRAEPLGLLLVAHGHLVDR